MRFGKKPAFAFAFLVLGFTAMSCGDDSDGGDDDSSACAVASAACLSDCIENECGESIHACSEDTTCDAAKDTMASCVCDAQRAGDTDAVDGCIQAFTDTGGMLSTPFIYCASTRCQSPCGL